MLQRLAPGLQRIDIAFVEMHAGQLRLAQQGKCLLRIAVAHGVGQCRQLQGFALAVAALQLHARTGEVGRFGFYRLGRQFAQQCAQSFGIGRVAALAITGGTQDGAEYVAGFHRRQLVGIAEQHQPGARRDCFDQLGHQWQVDHRGFVDHDDVVGQWVVAVVTEARGIRDHAEQAMQGGAGAGQLFAQGAVDTGGRQLLQGVAQAFGHAFGSAAGGCGQGDARGRLVCRLRLCGQQHQQAGDGGGLAGAGAAGDQQQVVAQGGGCGSCLVVWSPTLIHLVGTFSRRREKEEIRLR